MFTIPNCIEPFQMDRAMPLTSVCRSSRGKPRAAYTPKSIWGQGTSRADEAEQPGQRGRVAGPVLGDERGRRRADDIAQGERRDDRVIERAEDRDEVGDQVDR